MPHSPATVLIVDDEPAIQRFLKSTLEVQGWATVAAEDAAAALRAIRHHRPELILLDLGLPDRDGMQLLPESDRRLLYLWYVVQLPAKEIAQAMSDSGTGSF